MALQFIAGRSGSGKSYYIYKKILETAAKDPDSNYIILVPEQFSQVTQAELVRLSENNCIMNVDVMSMSRLAFKVFAETGTDQKPILGDEGKNMVLARLVRKHGKDLTVLKSLAEKFGAISTLKSLISELMQYGIEPEDMDEWQEITRAGELFKSKMADAGKIYREFLDYISERYLTAEKLPGILSRVVEKSEYVKNSTIVFDGYTGFVPTQLELIDRLLVCCRDIYVVATADSAIKLSGACKMTDLFYMSSRMTKAVMALAKERNVEILPTVMTEPEGEHRFKNSPALAHLESVLYRKKESVFEDAQDSIRIREAENPAQEAMIAATDILQAVRNDGLRYRDFAVITGDPESYGRIFAEVFENEGIPYFCDTKRPVSENPLVVFIVYAIQMVEGGFSYETVLSFLRSGLTQFTPGEIDILDNYVRAFGIRGLPAYAEEWKKKLKYTGDGLLKKTNEIRKRFYESVRIFSEEFKAGNRDVRSRTTALYRLIERCGIQQKLKIFEEKLLAEGRANAAAEYGRVYKVIVDYLDKAVEILGDEKLGAQSYLEMIEAGLSELSIGLVPSGFDQVIIGDMTRTRLGNVKVLIFAGLNEQLVPRVRGEKGILTERDRQLLLDNSVELSGNMTEELYRQRFYLYLSVTKPSEKLYLSYSRTDAAGKSSQPSSFLGDIQRLFGQLKKEAVGDEAGIGYGILSRSGRTDIIAGGLREPEEAAEDAAYLTLFNEFMSSAQGKEKAEDFLAAAFTSASSPSIGEDAAKALYGKGKLYSASRLEKFANCAFSHFVSYGLRAEKRQEYEFSPMDMGTLFHEAYRDFAEAVNASGIGWKEIDREKSDDLAGAAFDNAVRKNENTFMSESHRGKYSLMRWKELLKLSAWIMVRQVASGRFTPHSFEKQFTSDRVNGIIDRIDISRQQDCLYYRIIDYKTGKKEFDPGKLYHGLQIQLPLYMAEAGNVLEEEFPGIKKEPAGLYYYLLEDPVIEVDDMEKEVSEEQLREAMRLRGVSRSETEVLGLIDEELAPEVKSLVVDVKYKKDGTPDAYAKVLSGDEFYLLDRFVKAKTEELAQRIEAGDISISPARYDKEDGCRYCDFKSVCGYDEKIPGYNKRVMQKEKTADAIAKIGAYFGEEQDGCKLD